MKRQAWQDLRLRFVISHSLAAGQLYSMFPVTRHRQGCGRRPGPPPPSRGRMGITRPDLPLPLVPRFPEGSGSHSRRSETLVEICPTPFNTEIPGPEVWVGQAATAWKNGHPQALKAPLSWHFTPGKEYPLVLNVGADHQPLCPPAQGPNHGENLSEAPPHRAQGLCSILH